MASISSDIAEITVTLNSPGKTFNLGGLQCGYAIAKNSRLELGLSMPFVPLLCWN